jgi:hypothetical protein
MRLNEIDNSLMDHDIKIVETIKKNCSDSLSIFIENKSILYRGIKRQDTYFTGESPVNRIPVDTPKFLSFVIDDKLESCGFNALRSNSIFCTSNINHASAYSYTPNSLYVIFPINGFDYSYCKYNDLTEEIEWNTAEIQNMSTKEFIRNFGFKDINLGFGLCNGVEVYIHGKYIAVQKKSFSDYWLYEHLGINL